MRGRTKLVLAVAALVVTALAVTSFAVAGGGNGKGKNDDHGKSSTFGARLSGYNETPSLNSTGHATFTLTIQNDTMTFNALKDLLKTTDGNLSVHARKLEEGQYVACEKYFEGRVPRTEYRLTAAGRRALETYLEHMEALIRATRES